MSGPRGEARVEAAGAGLAARAPALSGGSIVRALLSLSISLSIVAAPSVSLAWGEERLRGIYAPSGVSAALAIHPSAPDGLALGVEQSLAFYAGTKRDLWFGLYGDGRLDLAAHRGRVGFGPEIGRGLLGFDGGVVAQLGGGRAQLGLEARLLLTASLFAIYARAGHLFGDEPAGFGEVGVLIKFPFALHTTERP